MGGMVGGEVATMFLDTNLGTHICLSASTDITVGELKKYFEEVHFSCLPDIGEIKVTTIMVEEKPYFYRLPNSVVMDTVFPDMGQPWVLRVQATPHLPQHHHHQNNTSSCSSQQKRSEQFHPSQHQSEKNEATIDTVVKEKGNSNKTSTPCEHQLEQHEDTIDDAVKGKGNSDQTSTPSEHQSEKHEDTIDDALKEKGNSHETSTPFEHQLEQHEATIDDDAVKEKGNCHESSTPCEHQLEQHEDTLDHDAVKEKGNSHETSTPFEHQLEQHEATIDGDAVKKKGNSHESSTQNAVSGTPERRSGSFGDKPNNGTPNKSECLMPVSKVENVVESRVNSGQGSQSKMSTQVISVTGLINKYFSGFNGITSSSDSDVTSRVVCTSEIEVQSTNRAQSYFSKRKIDAMPHHSTPKASKRRMKALPQLTPKTPVDMVSKTSGSKNTRFIVGERLLSASKSFRGCMTERSPSLSVCRFNDDRDKSQMNGSIFSISDSDH